MEGCTYKPRIAGNHQSRETGTELQAPSEAPEGANLADTMISDFQSPVCETINVCVLSHPVWGTWL